MQKVTRDDLIRWEYIKLDYFADYEIWGCGDERIIWNPVTEEISSKYQIKKERSE
jgi:hypothetical protein